MSESNPPFTAIAPADRRYRPVVHSGEEGYYEVRSDAHLYDLLGAPLGDLEDFGPQHSEDILVVSAAWSVPGDHEPRVERWLLDLRSEPAPWLTPWRQGEAAITAHVWLDRSAAVRREGPAMLVARVDNTYVRNGALRASMDQALARFDDFRRSFETRLASGAAVSPVRATLQWMTALDIEDEDAELESSMGNLDV